MTEKLPWCDDCECYSVPTEARECGACGGSITHKEVE